MRSAREQHWRRAGSRQRRQQVRSEPTGGPGLPGRRANPPARPSVRPSVRPLGGRRGCLLPAGRPAREASERPERQGCGLPETRREEEEECLTEDPKGNRENAKEAEPSKSSGDSTVTETEEGKKIKAPKKQKLFREIPMELGVSDMPDLLEDKVKSLMKKDV
ncbi:uncharacterized protein ACIB01_015080 isoform 1-T1 [Guaruba guarouba]